jgi:hypothetical protein
MHHMLQNSAILRSSQCVLCGSENKQRLFPYRVLKYLTDCSSQSKHNLFSARQEPNFVHNLDKYQSSNTLFCLNSDSVQCPNDGHVVLKGVNKTLSVLSNILKRSG